MGDFEYDEDLLTEADLDPEVLDMLENADEYASYDHQPYGVREAELY